MNFKLLHRVSAFFVFLVSSIVFLMTVAPTLSFWDCGEFITSAVTLGVPHPPGAPFFQLVGRIFSFIPFGDIGWRVNLQAVFSSSISVLFVHLIIMRLLRLWHGEPQSISGGLIMILSAATGALVMGFSDTFWFSAVESEVYAIGVFFITIVVWMGLEWYAKAGMFNTERTLLMIAYIVGLSIGIHLLSLLAIFFVFFLVYLRDRDKSDITVVSVLLFLLAMAVGFAFAIYPGTVKWLPDLLTSTGGTVFVLLVIGALAALSVMKSVPPVVRVAVMSWLLVILGYTTFAMIPIRSNQDTALNENAPGNMEALYKYLNREQYGTYPLLSGASYDNAIQNIDMSKKKMFPRRWNPESIDAYKKYSSDLDFFLSYQTAHLFGRYFLWNFVGRAGDLQDAPAVLFSMPAGEWSESPGWPNKFYAIPLLLGLIGMYYNFRKDWRTGAAMMAFFVIMGIALVVYFNMHEPQVRERDYFWVGAFVAFSIWVGIGVYGIWDFLKGKLGNNEGVGVVLGLALVIAGPGVMLNASFRTHDRHLNYVAFDYAYNLLQSCDQDAILFTGGDNDTFPVWYMQYVAGVRRDVRIVNLSLVNTQWYAKQLKNERPYGAKTVDFSFSDEQMEQMEPIAWETQTFPLPIDKKYFAGTPLNDVPEIRGAGLPDTMKWTIDAPWRDGRGTKGLRMQDIYIFDIVRKNLNARPIYFALSTSPSDRLGLDPFMQVEGLAARVTPYRFQNHPYRYYPAVNIPMTVKHLTTPRTEPDSNRAFGFMFRELNNPAINLEEPSRKMVYSFRLLFMELAKAVFQEQNDKKTATELLDRMEKIMPESIHRMTNDVKIQLALSYYVLRDVVKTRQMADQLEAVLMPDVERFIRGESQSRQSLSVLLDLYEVSQQYGKGVDIMKRYKQVHPEDPGVDAQIQSWEARSKMPLDTASR